MNILDAGTKSKSPKQKGTSIVESVVESSVESILFPNNPGLPDSFSRCSSPLTTVMRLMDYPNWNAMGG